MVASASSDCEGVWGVGACCARALCVRSHSLPRLTHTLRAQVEPAIVAPISCGGVGTTEVCAAVQDAARAEDDYERLEAPSDDS